MLAQRTTSKKNWTIYPNCLPPSTGHARGQRPHQADRQVRHHGHLPLRHLHRHQESQLTTYSLPLMIQSLSVRGLFTKFDGSLAGFSRPRLSTSTWWTLRPTRRSTTEWWAWDAIQSNFNRCFTLAKSLKSLKNLSKFNRIVPHQLPTPLRTHPAYTAYYNWSRLIVLGIIPFVLLVYLNTKIYQVLICRKVS